MKLISTLYSIVLLVVCVRSSGITKFGQPGLGFPFYKVIFVDSNSREPLEYILSFPEVIELDYYLYSELKQFDLFQENDPQITINGITFMDFNPVTPNISFIDGGIGDSFIKVKITAEPSCNIMANAIFYCTVNNTASNESHNLNNFFESNVNIDFNSR